MADVIRLAIFFCVAGVFLAEHVHCKLSRSIEVMEIRDEHTREATRVLPDLESQHSMAHNTLISEETGNEEQNPGEVEENEHGVNDTLNVEINLDSYVNNIGPRFVGLTLDSSVFRRHWKLFNTSSKQLQSLAKGLAPSFLRMGGTAADFLIFDGTKMPEETMDGIEGPLIQNYTVTGKVWEQLNDFIQEVGWDLIFDVNQFLRKGQNWDPYNARELLTFSQEHNFSIPCFQIGNEPNAYFHNFGFRIPGSRLAEDMQQLRAVLNEFPLYRNSYIIGPDVTKVTKHSAREYLEEFLMTGGQDIVAAVTLHHYYFNVKQHGGGLKDFFNVTILNSLKQELSIALSITHALAPDVPVWFSETSSVSGGGVEGVCDGFVAGFMWLDKLGLSALSGFKAVLRQTFFNGYYALISEELVPYPDYFLTVLYKRLLQGPVFNVTSSTDTVRMYAGCASPASYQKGALTVYILNVRNRTATLNFTQFSGHQYELYLLTPGDEQGLRSPFVALNGQKLVMVDEELPPLHPLIGTGRVTFPALSFGFVVIPDAGVKFCS